MKTRKEAEQIITDLRKVISALVCDANLYVYPIDLIADVVKKWEKYDVVLQDWIKSQEEDK